jgi:hypothetical protein
MLLPGLIFCLAAASSLSVAPNSSSSPPTLCVAQLQALCAADQGDPVKCGECAGVHAAPLKAAGCTEAIINQWCTHPAPPPSRGPLALSLLVTPDTLTTGQQSQFQAQLMGVTAYGARGDFLWYNTKLGAEWLEEWGVEAVGFGNDAYPLPPDCEYDSSQCPVTVSGGTGDSRNPQPCPGPNFNESRIADFYADGGPGGARRWMFDYPSLGAADGPTIMFGKLLKTARAGGAEPFMYLEYSLPGDMSGCGNSTQSDIQAGPPKNATLWGVAAAAYLNLAREADPNLHFAHLTNEPNANWYKNTDHEEDDYASFFANASTAIKAAVPGIQLGGPAVANGVGSEQDWTWLPTLMDATLPNNLLDFADFHAYGEPENYDMNAEGVSVVGQASTIAAYAQIRHNKTLASAVTETNWGFYNLSSWLDHAAHTRRRSLPIARQILSMAKNPDKCLLRHMHDMSADAGGLFTFRSDPPNPTMQLYQLLKPLRGTRLWTSLSDPSFIVKPMEDQDGAMMNLGPAVLVEAVGDASTGRFVLAIANFGTRALQLAVNLTALGASSRQAKIRSATLDVVSYRTNLSLLAPPATSQAVNWTFPPESVSVVQIDAPPVTVSHCSVTRTEYYPDSAAEIMMPITNFTPHCVRTHPLAPGCQCSLNTSRPLSLEVAVPAPRSLGQISALFVRLGTLARPSHACDDKTESTKRYLDSGGGRWRLRVGENAVEFAGGPFVELPLPVALLSHQRQRAATGSTVALSMSLELMLNESHPSAAGNLSVVPPDRTLMFVSALVEVRSCRGS